LTKVCRQCERELPLIKFDKNPASPHLRRGTCRQCRGSKQPRARAPDAPAEARFTRPLNATRYLITSAQNATPVHAEFFAALQVAAKHLRAELVVIPFRYKNPTSQWTQAQAAHEHWAPELAPYLHNTRKKLNANLVLAADVKTQPTASSPLSGFEALTGAESCIIGHPKMQLRTVPAPIGRLPKILSTTGAVTQRNYTDTKAGKLGEFHHFLGAIIVEIDGPWFALRQINADRRTGEFTDLDLHFTSRGVRQAPPAAGLVMGDMHARFTSPEVERATFSPGGIVDTLKPLKLVWHDLLDGYAVNPHHLGNPFIAHAKAQAGFGDPEAEVKHAVKFVADRTPAGSESVIVASNHDDFLARWINAADWRQVGAKVFYLRTALAMLERTQMTAQGTEYEDPFRYWVGVLRGKAKIRALQRNEPLKIKDIECGHHGHRGPNGSKATMKNMARVGEKITDAHGHSPGIEEGHYRVGTSTPLQMEYTGGPSSWANCHCVTYDTGKRALIFMSGGRWRLQSQPLRRAA
jgi:hypothetical protein